MQLFVKSLCLALPDVWTREGNDWVSVDDGREARYRVTRDNSCWSLFRGEEDVLAVCETTALHPATIPHEDVWKDARTGVGLLIVFDYVSFKSSYEHPFAMGDLGLDFFAARRPTNRIFFVCPLTGEVQHSGCKATNMLPPGKRYCHRCHRLYSANNFIHQHWKLHPKLARNNAVTYQDIALLI